MTLQTGDRFHSSSRQESIFYTVKNGSFDDSDSIASISYKNTQSHEALPLILAFEWNRLWPSVSAYHILIREWIARIDECPIFKLWGASPSVHLFPSSIQLSQKREWEEWWKVEFQNSSNVSNKQVNQKELMDCVKEEWKWFKERKERPNLMPDNRPNTLAFITSPHYKMDPRNNSTIFRMEGWLSGRGV